MEFFGCLLKNNQSKSNIQHDEFIQNPGLNQPQERGIGWTTKNVLGIQKVPDWHCELPVEAQRPRLFPQHDLCNKEVAGLTGIMADISPGPGNRGNSERAALPIRPLSIAIETRSFAALNCLNVLIEPNGSVAPRDDIRTYPRAHAE
jgi:hypothetical protein